MAILMFVRQANQFRDCLPPPWKRRNKRIAVAERAKEIVLADISISSADKPWARSPQGRPLLYFNLLRMHTPIACGPSEVARRRLANQIQVGLSRTGARL